MPEFLFLVCSVPSVVVAAYDNGSMANLMRNENNTAGDHCRLHNLAVVIYWWIYIITFLLAQIEDRHEKSCEPREPGSQIFPCNVWTFLVKNL